MKPGHRYHEFSGYYNRNCEDCKSALMTEQEMVASEDREALMRITQIKDFLDGLVWLPDLNIQISKLEEIIGRRRDDFRGRTDKGLPQVPGPEDISADIREGVG